MPMPESMAGCFRFTNASRRILILRPEASSTSLAAQHEHASRAPDTQERKRKCLLIAQALKRWGGNIPRNNVQPDKPRSLFSGAGHRPAIADFESND